MEADRSLKFDYKQFNRENLLKIVSRFGDPREVSVLYVSTYNPNYTRTQALLGLFERAQIRVKKVLVGGSKLKYPRAVYGLTKCKAGCDLIVVAFRGHEILPILSLFADRPIIFDAFISMYDTLCFERQVLKPNSLAGRFLKAYDRFLCRISDVVLVDTRAHKEYFETEFGARNVEYLYIGCNESMFRPMQVQEQASKFSVLWYGSAIPVHGIEVILKAAKLLEGTAIVFRVFGPIRKRYSALTDDLNTNNIEFGGLLSYEKLPIEINRADLCLGGHFSDVNKAKRTIAGKTFEFLACGKPTIVGDSPANRELFEEGGLVHFVKMNDPEALAGKVLEVKEG